MAHAGFQLWHVGRAVLIEQLRAVFRQPEIVTGTGRALRTAASSLGEDEARKALLQLDPLWAELFPADQARIWGGTAAAFYGL